VWRLLGGKVRDRIRMYGWLSLEPTGDYIDLYAKSINENIEGFTAYKTCPIPPMQMIEQPHVLHAIRDNIVLLRDKVDKRIDLALDFHGRCTPAMVSLLELFVILIYDCFVVSTTDSYD
jgi:galactonate dehydratase